MLAFTKDGILTNEFDNLFASLFDMHKLSIEIIKILVRQRGGVSQEEIFKKIGGIKGKLGIQKLKELESAGFIIRFKPYLHSKKGVYYKIVDEYTLFYLDWILPIKDSLIHRASASGYWEKQQNVATWYSWAGYAFEAICYKHVSQIRDALHLDVSSLASTWRFTSRTSDQRGAQIDLLFDRPDDAITLCEIKFTNKPFHVDKSYSEILENKIRIFKEITRTRKQIFLAIISASGLQNSKYTNTLISNILTLEDLFRLKN